MDGARIAGDAPGQLFPRSLFEARHARLRADVAAFLDAEVVGPHADWTAQAETPPGIWARAGQAGLLCRTIPECYGGKGGDFRDSVVVIEELAARRLSGLPTFLQSDILAPFLLRLGREDQKRRHMPGLASGATIGAVALTEPHSGSDLHAMTCTARRVGDGYEITGDKTHISNGARAGLIVVAARSEGNDSAAGPGLSLFLVEAGADAAGTEGIGGPEGLTRRVLPKTGMRALETAHLEFRGCRLPESARLGPEGMGFLYLMTSLVAERLVLAIYAQAAAEAQLRALIADCEARKTRAGNLLDYQHIRFQLADLYGTCAVNRSFVDQCIAAHLDGRLDPRSACLAKLRASEAQREVAAQGVQLRGAAGVGAQEGGAMQDLVDASAQTIWGGSSEVMRDLVGRSLANIL